MAASCWTRPAPNTTRCRRTGHRPTGGKGGRNGIKLQRDPLPNRRESGGALCRARRHRLAGRQITESLQSRVNAYRGAVREGLALSLELGQRWVSRSRSTGAVTTALIEELVPAADPGSRSFMVRAPLITVVAFARDVRPVAGTGRHPQRAAGAGRPRAGIWPVGPGVGQR